MQNHLAPYEYKKALLKRNTRDNGKIIILLSFHMNIFAAYNNTRGI